MRYKTYVGCLEGETQYESGSIWIEIYTSKRNHFEVLANSI